MRDLSVELPITLPAQARITSRRWLTAAPLGILLVLLLAGSGCRAQKGPDVYPLGQHYELRFAGGIRLQKGAFGASGIASRGGPFAVDEEQSRIWTASRVKNFAVGAFALPQLSARHEIADYPLAANVDPFAHIRPPRSSAGGKRKAPNRITGMQLIDGRLFVNATVYYDAAGQNIDTTMIFEQPALLAESAQSGYFQMDGSAHSAGWMQPVPLGQQKLLGGAYLAGYAANIPIASRHSNGPSLFIWTPPGGEAVATGEDSRRIAATPLIDYPLKKSLHEDSYNESGKNDLWTVSSTAVLGFISPTGRDYLVIGTSAGHVGGLGYKIVQDNGKLCGGPCPRLHDDRYNYYWRYSLADIARVRSGELQPHEVRPVEYGKLKLPASINGKLLTGAAFSPDTGRLYIMVGNADDTQGATWALPVLLVFDVLDTENVG